MITVSDDDISYIEENIPNFSEFVRTKIAEHRIIYDQIGDELTALKFKLSSMTKEFGAEKQILEEQIEKLEKVKNNILYMKEKPEVISAISFLKSGKGNITSVAANLSKTFGIPISASDLAKWVNE